MDKVFVCAKWSVYSWKGGLVKCVGRHKSGVKYAYVDFNALKVAFMKFPFVRVCPQEHEKTSATPAKAIIFFMVGEPTTPLPRGAGINRTLTDPHFPWTFIGIV